MTSFNDTQQVLPEKRKSSNLPRKGDRVLTTKVFPEEMSQATQRGVQNIFETVDGHGMLELEWSKPTCLIMWTDFRHNHLQQILNIFRILHFR